MKTLIKIFLTILPALYLGNAMGDDDIVFILKGKITGPDSPTITINGSQCTFNGKSTSTRLDEIGEYSRRIVCAKDTQTITLNTSSSSSIYNVTPTTHTIDLSKLPTSSRAVLDINTKQTDSILVAQEEAAAAAFSTNTATSSKKAPKATSSEKKNEMKEKALEDFCEPIQLTGKLADGKINEQCDPQNPTIKIMCYKTKNEINQERLKKRYNNYCFSNMKNSVDIGQYTKRDCNNKELESLNAISCTKYDDGEDTNFQNIECDNTNFAYFEGKCVKPKYTHSITLQIKDNTKKHTNQHINLWKYL